MLFVFHAIIPAPRLLLHVELLVYLVGFCDFVPQKVHLPEKSPPTQPLRGSVLIFHRPSLQSLS